MASTQEILKQIDSALESWSTHRVKSQYDDLSDLPDRSISCGFTARYVRMPRLLHEMAVGRGDGSYARLLVRLAKLDLLAIDDWLLAPLRDAERRDLTEVIEDRAERASTLIASQLPLTDWRCRHRRPEPSGRDLRPVVARCAPPRAEGLLDAADEGGPHDTEEGHAVINRRLKRGVVQVGRGRESASHGILVGGFEAAGLWILPAVWKTRPDLREDDSAAACVSHTALDGAHNAPPTGSTGRHRLPSHTRQRVG